MRADAWRAYPFGLHEDQRGGRAFCTQSRAPSPQPLPNCTGPSGRLNGVQTLPHWAGLKIQAVKAVLHDSFFAVYCSTIRAHGALSGMSHSRLTRWRKSRRSAGHSTFARVRSSGLETVVAQARLAGSKTNVGTSSAREGFVASGVCRVRSLCAHKAPRKAGDDVHDSVSSEPFACCTHSVR